jgi:hypothetical protein
VIEREPVVMCSIRINLIPRERDGKKETVFE